MRNDEPYFTEDIDFEFGDRSASGEDAAVNTLAPARDEDTVNASDNASAGKEKPASENSSKAAHDHEEKLFVAQKGRAVCDKGTSFPQFKVNSQQKFYINDQKNNDEYLAVTGNDVTFNPPAMPFGNCSLQNGKPCAYIAAGKWQKCYTDMKVTGNSLLTEISELQCAAGGKIKVLDHGQRTQLTKGNFKNAASRVHQHLNAAVNLDELNEEIDGDDNICI